MWTPFGKRKRQQQLLDSLAEVSWEAEIGVAIEKAKVVSREPAFPEMDYLASYALQMLRDAGSLPPQVASSALAEALDCHTSLAEALWADLEKKGFVKTVGQVSANQTIMNWIIPTRRSYLMFAGMDGEVPLL